MLRWWLVLKSRSVAVGDFVNGGVDPGLQCTFSLGIQGCYLPRLAAMKTQELYYNCTENKLKSIKESEIVNQL